MPLTILLLLFSEQPIVKAVLIIVKLALGHVCLIGNFFLLTFLQLFFLTLDFILMSLVLVEDILN